MEGRCWLSMLLLFSFSSLDLSLILMTFLSNILSISLNCRAFGSLLLTKLSLEIKPTGGLSSCRSCKSTSEFTNFISPALIYFS